MVILLHLQQRKLQRLKNYDYSWNGAYFITICTFNRVHLFGQIDNGELFLNNAGRMVLTNSQKYLISILVLLLINLLLCQTIYTQSY